MGDGGHRGGGRSAVGLRPSGTQPHLGGPVPDRAGAEDGGPQHQEDGDAGANGEQGRRPWPRPRCPGHRHRWPAGRAGRTGRCRPGRPRAGGGWPHRGLAAISRDRMIVPRTRAGLSARPNTDLPNSTNQFGALSMTRLATATTGPGTGAAKLATSSPAASAAAPASRPASAASGLERPVVASSVFAVLMTSPEPMTTGCTSPSAARSRNVQNGPAGSSISWERWNSPSPDLVTRGLCTV